MLRPGDDFLASAKKLGGLKLYGQSKLVSGKKNNQCHPSSDIGRCFSSAALQGNILFSNELARRYGGDGIVSISLHPGNFATDLGSDASLAMKIFGRLITYPLSYGPITSLYAGTAPAAGELNGKVGSPTSRIRPCYVTMNNLHPMNLFSISPPGHASRSHIRRHSIQSSRRNCGNGVKNKSRTSRTPLLAYRLCLSIYSSFWAI
jgi:hypothetical protein